MESPAVPPPMPPTPGLLAPAATADGDEAGAGPVPSGPPVEGYADEQPLHHASGFFNQPWVQNVLPLATSLLLHVSLIVVGVLLVAAIPPLINANKEQVIIPQTSSLAKSATPGGVRHMGPPADPTRSVAQDQSQQTDNTGFAADVGNKLAAAGSPADAVASRFLGEKAGGGKGRTFGNSAGGGTAPFGVPGGGEGLLPKSDFMGTGGNANDIVFLCDSSGSMLSVFDTLKLELKKAINQMAVDDNGAQRFNVIFFADGDVTALFKDGLHPATADNKRRAADFITGASCFGQTNPVPAIRFALAEHPQLLYVLTDGFENVPDMSVVTNLFRRGDPDGRIHINCIYLESEEDSKLVQALKEIATIGQGDMKIISKKDMF